jgi:hypothetical protein
MINAHTVLVGKSEGKILHGRFRRVVEDNIKVDFKKLVCVVWIYVVRDRVQWFLLAPELGIS